jgi:hypothetical protein
VNPARGREKLVCSLLFSLDDGMAAWESCPADENPAVEEILRVVERQLV